VRTIMGDAGTALMGIGRGSGRFDHATLLDYAARYFCETCCSRSTFFEGAMVHTYENPALQLTSPFVCLYFPLNLLYIFCYLTFCLLLLSIYLLLSLYLSHSIAILRDVSHVKRDPLVLNHLFLCQIISYHPPHLAIFILSYLALCPRQIQSPGGCSCRYFLSFAGLPHREGDCCTVCISELCVCVYVDLI
jgi:hypothetical protein